MIAIPILFAIQALVTGLPEKSSQPSFPPAAVQPEATLDVAVASPPALPRGGDAVHREDTGAPSSVHTSPPPLCPAGYALAGSDDDQPICGAVDRGDRWDYVTPDGTVVPPVAPTPEPAAPPAVGDALTSPAPFAASGSGHPADLDGSGRIDTPQEYEAVNELTRAVANDPTIEDRYVEFLCHHVDGDPTVMAERCG